MQYVDVLSTSVQCTCPYNVRCTGAGSTIKVLNASEIWLPDTLVIRTIYITPDVDDDRNETVYNSNVEVGPS